MGNVCLLPLSVLHGCDGACWGQIFHSQLFFVDPLSLWILLSCLVLWYTLTGCGKGWPVSHGTSLRLGGNGVFALGHLHRADLLFFFPGFESVPSGLAFAVTAPGSYGFIGLFALSGALELGLWTESDDKEPSNFGDPVGFNQYTQEMRETGLHFLTQLSWLSQQIHIILIHIVQLRSENSTTAASRCLRLLVSLQPSCTPARMLSSSSGCEQIQNSCRSALTRPVKRVPVG